jgi:hypothetical protein
MANVPDVELISSPMGGAWANPLTDKGREACEDILGEEAAGGMAGYVLEPPMVDEFVELAIGQGCRVMTPNGTILPRGQA